MNCTSGCPSNALSYNFKNPLNEDYRLNQFLPKLGVYKHINIKEQFKNLRNMDYYILPITLILGYAIDGLYGIGHFMAYGLSLIAAYTILFFIKNFSVWIKTIITFIILSFFLWHGIIKYSIWKGFSNYKNGNYQEAIINLERAISIYPKSIGKFHIMLSEMYLEQGNKEIALNHAQKAKLINPNHTSPDQLIKIINSE